MNYHEFPINQSIIRSVLHNGEERLFCPRRLFLTKIDRTIVEPPTDPMLFGRYFETKCILSSSSGEKQSDLPRKRLKVAQKRENAVRKQQGLSPLKGDKYLHHIRIDEQVSRFHVLAKKYKIMVNENNTQVPLYAIWDQDPDVMLKAELDIFPTTILLKDELDAAIIDLKLTSDIHNTYGEYCYGSPEYLDLIQAKMYHYLVRNIDIKMNPQVEPLLTDSVKKLIKDDRILFLLWIFNYKGNDLEDKFIQVKWDENKENELNESIRKTIAILDSEESNGWPTNPKYELCKNCPWKDCPDRIKVETV